MHIRKPVTVKRIKHILSICEVECQLSNMITIDNFFLNSELKVQVRRSYNRSYYFYVFDKERCVALFEFENNNVSKNILKLSKYKNIYIPHATVDPEYERLGLGTSVYTYFLLNAPGATLITFKHTKSAARLWNRVSSRINKEIVYHNLVTGQDDKRPTTTNMKVLTC